MARMIEVHRAGRKKRAPGRFCPYGGRRLVKDKANRTTVTAAGRVELTRRSTRCPDCGLTSYPADARVGTGGFLSPQATRLVCLAAASWSFDIASDRLEEIGGLRVDDETIRRHCHQAAAGLTALRQAEPPNLTILADGAA